MAVETPYTTAARITRLVGQIGIDLRTDDADDLDTADDYMQDAVDVGSTEVDFYLSRYSAADAATNEWVIQHATWFAVRQLCMRRLNDLPASVKEECERREKQLMLVLEGKVPAPRLANSRRPIAATNYHVDLNRRANQVRVVRSKSTGVAQDYNRPTDESSPDDR
jgi:hypothetical protein